MVEFWPLAIPEPRTGVETTSGEQYVSPEVVLSSCVQVSQLTRRSFFKSNLYRLATQTSSDWVLDMLPDLHSSFSGGWLFEYSPEGYLGSHPVKSRRWAYRSTHKIEASATQQVEDFEGVEDVEDVEDFDGDDCVETELTEEQKEALMRLESECIWPEDLAMSL